MFHVIRIELLKSTYICGYSDGSSSMSCKGCGVF